MDKLWALTGIILATIGGILTGYAEMWEPLKWISPMMIFFSTIIVMTCIDVARKKRY